MREGRLEPVWRWRTAWLVALLAAAPACHRASADPNEQQSRNAEQAFTTVCARCHGSDGKGGVAPEGSNAPRNFCDSAFQASRTDEQLKQVIRKGKGSMPAFGNLFSDSDLQGLVHKIRSFDPSGKLR